MFGSRFYSSSQTLARATGNMSVLGNAKYEIDGIEYAMKLPSNTSANLHCGHAKLAELYSTGCMEWRMQSPEFEYDLKLSKRGAYIVQEQRRYVALIRRKPFQDSITCRLAESQSARLPFLVFLCLYFRYD